METTLANQLRIGNYLNYLIEDNLDERKKWLEPHKIDATDICIIEKIKDHNFEPIPLTEEILLKCGFFKKLGYGYNNVRMTGGLYLSTCLSYFVYQYYDIRIEIKFLHELQNIFYILEKTELEINL